MERKLKFIGQAEETKNIQKLAYNIKRFDKDWIDDQTLMLMVSPDFSGIVTTILAQALSGDDGEIMYTDCIHVPDPDEDLNKFKFRFQQEWAYIKTGFEEKPYHKFILAEAGVISGGNYTWLTDMMINSFGVPRENIRTVALYENIHSKFKCDYVAEYYDNETEDLCFWWEKPNAAFGDYSEQSSKQ